MLPDEEADDIRSLTGKPTSAASQSPLDYLEQPDAPASWYTTKLTTRHSDQRVMKRTMVLRTTIQKKITIPLVQYVFLNTVRAWFWSDAFVRFSFLTPFCRGR